tara:strand:- start:4290 stop:4394 length:105 start_codon:yes stop_codon:yes gene_type:complete
MLSHRVWSQRFIVKDTDGQAAAGRGYLKYGDDIA